MLRLHLNENTAGCSPAVVEALGALTRQDAAFYPDYGAALGAVASHFAVDGDRVLLTNGLDEGILAAAAAAFRDRRDAGPPEALTLSPAFDMYGVVTRALGGRTIDVPMLPPFDFPLAALCAAVSGRTRIVFVTNPHNPTGRLVGRDDLFRLADAVAPAVLFVDEAYADFARETLISGPQLGAHSNIVVGRTFSKAHGLAALRAGALIGDPAVLAPMRAVVPPYSLNAAAAAALPAALADRAYIEWYLDEVDASKRMLSDACVRLGLDYVPSAANFMLVRIGPHATDVVRALAARGILVRNRSGEPGCDGWIRLTTGVADHTRRLVSALGEVLCAKAR